MGVCLRKAGVVVVVVVVVVVEVAEVVVEVVVVVRVNTNFGALGTFVTCVRSPASRYSLASSVKAIPSQGRRVEFPIEQK